MRKSILATIGVALVASLLTWTAHGRINLQGKTDPFTYEMIATYFHDGVVTRTKHVIRAVRRDGSFAAITRMRAPNGQEYEMREVMDLVKLQRSISYPIANVITTAPISPQSAERLRADRGKRCGIQKGARSSRLHGYDVIQSKFRSGGEVPAEESLEIEKWHAPQFGCEPLDATWKKGGQVVLVREVKRLETGEPTEDFFRISPEYVEVSPVEAALRLAEVIGVGASGPLSSMERQVEEQYHGDRKAAGWD